MRSPAIVLLLISIFFVKFARAQSNELIIEGQTGKLYLLHTVVAKENWYSIGRLYNVNPKGLAPFNNLPLNKPLDIGQQLEIPLTTVNFSQTGQKGAANETLVPVYHIIQEKEWLYRISVNHNKVTVGNLEKWNNINKDQAKAGMHLIVGFLKVKTALSALATSAGGGVAATSPVPVHAEPAVKEDTRPVTHTASPTTISATDKPSTGKGSEDKPSMDKPSIDKASTTGKGSEDKPSIDKASIDKASIDNKTSAGKPSTGKISTDKPLADKASTDKSPAEKLPAANKTVTPAATPFIHFNGGYFSTDFNETGKSAGGQAGIFKSTSGWQDGKYYALMNNVPVGTIVKITVPSLNKSVYAKILGQLPDMKESVGMTIRISNAAANELGEADGKFNVEVRY